MLKLRTLGVIFVLVGAMALAACGDDDNGSSDSGSSTSGDGGGSGSIALLLPESKTARYESQDRPNFEAKAKELCADCEIIYSNADQDAAKQQQQAEAAITKGAKVLVLDPVDAASAGAIVNRAKQAQIPVISYDRLITDADIDYYISFDNEQVGKLQGESLVKKLTDDGAKGSIIMINGAPTDNNAKLFKEGAHSVIDSSDYKVAKEYDTPDWSPDKAQQEMEQAITAVGKDGFVGVYAANDGTGRRRDRCDEGQRHRSQDPPDDRAGRGARGHPAHPHRRAVHDRLQGDQGRGRSRGGARGGARHGQGRRPQRTTRSTTG